MFFKRGVATLAATLLYLWQLPVMAAQASKVNTLGQPEKPAGQSIEAAGQKIDNQSSSINQGQPVLSIQPATCVALHQGRTCFAQLSLNWQTKGVGNFCIYLKNKQQPLHCWQNSRGNLLNFEFESDKKVVFQLIEQGQTQIMAETSVDVSWVHKAAPRKRRWRLF